VRLSSTRAKARGGTSAVVRSTVNVVPTAASRTAPGGGRSASSRTERSSGDSTGTESFLDVRDQTAHRAPPVVEPAAAGRAGPRREEVAVRQARVAPLLHPFPGLDERPQLAVVRSGGGVTCDHG